ncbi:MAG: GIY-YIG nuclease family protein [Patescibacteria group bacterium]
MNKKDVSFKDFPDAPGVYFFRGSKREVLYVGKATSLRDRVKSYFASNIAEIRSPLIEKIVTDASTLEFEQTDSVLEALILEAKLIKKYTPVGNTSNKDNKSWNFIVVTKETFPRVLVVRERELAQRFPAKTVKELFGPFPSAVALREALKIIRKIFPFFDTEFPVGAGKLTPAQEKKIRFNQSIGLYPQTFNKGEYQKTIRAIIDIFSANKAGLVKRLEREMNAKAATHHFEEAEVLKRKVFALRHIQDLTLIKEELKKPESTAYRIEAFDVAHLRGSSPRGVMVVVEDGEVQKSQYRLFTIRNGKAGDDYAALDEVLTRRFSHREWPLPHLVVIDGGKAHVARAKKTLFDLGYSGDIVSVVKDEKHRPREVLGNPKITFPHEAAILLANSEAHRFSIGRHRKALRKR